MKTHTNHSYIFVILCLRLSSECETPCSLEHPALITIVVISIFTTVNRYRNAVTPTRIVTTINFDSSDGRNLFR